MTSSFRSIVDVCRDWADAVPRKVGYSCLSDGEDLKEQLTFGALDERARAIAAVLQRQTTPGDRVLLLYPTGVEYVVAFMACLYARLVAVPAYPVHGRDRRWEGRLRAIVGDATPRAALTVSDSRALIDAAAAADPSWGGLWVVATDTIDAAEAAAWREPSIDADTLAFLQYTSGTTSAPRGVMVSHGNLVHQEALIQRTFAQHSNSVVVSWLPLYHDMGLIGSVLQTLYAGAHCVLMSPAAFLQRPARWLQAIHRFAATTSGGPNFAYDLCAKKVREEDRAGLELSTWDVAFNGAELVRADTMKRFATIFGPCGFTAQAFRPCYGLAESTLMVTACADTWFDHAVPADPAEAAAASEPQPSERRVVSCGPLDGEQRVLIVDPETLAPCAPGRIGEVWVGGPSVTMGYWQRERESVDVFHASPSHAAASRRYLRTGDLGFEWQGQLFLAGRLKDMIIVRGRNHFPDDLEATIERAVRGLRSESCVACEADVDGTARLLVIQEVDRAGAVADPNETIGLIRAALVREHGLNPYAVALVEPRSIPRTPSGKKQRRLCGEDFARGRLRIVASGVLTDVPDAPAAHHDAGHRPAMDDQLVGCLTFEVARVLGVSEAAIGPDVPLASAGLDSVHAAELQAALEARLGVKVPARELFDDCSVARLADVIRAAQTTGAAPVAADDRQRAVLSDAEKAMWFLHKLAANSGVHTIARAARIGGLVDWAALCRAMRAVVARHEALRTTFPASGGQPCARVHDRFEPELVHADASGWTDDALQRALDAFSGRPFSLENGPLVRLGLFTRSATDHVLALVVHHIVADLWSVCVVIDELGQLYGTEIAGVSSSLTEPAASYRDYLAHRHARLAAAEGQRLQTYWQSTLAGSSGPTDLPTSRPRSTSAQFASATERVHLDAALVAALRQLGHEQGATLYMVLLAAFQAFLRTHVDSDDVVVGSPFHGRSDTRASALVGCLTNLLVLRARVPRDRSFAEHLATTRESVAGALDHQDYPFQRLVETLRPHRDAGRMPLCSIVFVFQSVPRGGAWPLFAIGEPGARLEVGPLQLESIAASRETTAFDLTVTAAPFGDELAIAWNYRSDLFDRSAVRAMAAHFCELLRRIAAEPHRHIGCFAATDASTRAAELAAR